MSVTISDAGVTVNIVRETSSPSQRGFGALLFMHTVAGGITDRIKYYSNISAVAEDFGSTDEPYLSAVAFFSQNPSPTDFYVGQVDGDASELYADALDAMVEVNSNFYCVTVEKVARDDVALISPIASWAEVNERVFFNVSNDINVLDIGDDSDIASALQTSGYQRTITTYSSVVDEYPDASAFAILATTSYSGTDTTKTLKYKDLAGISVESLTSASLQSIRSKNCNVLFETASSRMYDSGITAGGSWIDEVIGADALAEEIRVRVFGALTRTSTKIPYNEKGMATLEAEVEGALIQYVVNGYLTTRTTTDGDLLPAYTIDHKPIIDVSATDKSQRIAPDIEFTARVAGAIHDILINGTLVLD